MSNELWGPQQYEHTKSGTGTGGQSIGFYLNAGDYIIDNVSVKVGNTLDCVFVDIIVYTYNGDGSVNGLHIGSGWASGRVPFVVNGPIRISGEVKVNLTTKGYHAYSGYHEAYWIYRKRVA